MPMSEEVAKAMEKAKRLKADAQRRCLLKSFVLVA